MKILEEISILTESVKNYKLSKNPLDIIRKIGLRSLRKKDTRLAKEFKNIIKDSRSGIRKTAADIRYRQILKDKKISPQKKLEALKIRNADPEYQVARKKSKQILQSKKSELNAIRNAHKHDVKNKLTRDKLQDEGYKQLSGISSAAKFAAITGGLGATAYGAKKIYDKDKEELKDLAIEKTKNVINNMPILPSELAEPILKKLPKQRSIIDKFWSKV
jgi:hypothetical protein